MLVFALFAFAVAIGVSDERESFFAGVHQLQLGPALVRLVAQFAPSALFVVLGILALTFLFGRFYCAFCCPLGILQDFLGWLSPNRAKPVKNLRALRYVIALAAFASLAAGLAVGFKLLDPFSNFGRMAATTLTPAAHFIQPKFFPTWYLDSRIIEEGVVFYFGAALLVLLAGLVVWKRRIFCTALCPVGTLLGLFSARGLFKLKLRDCVHCGRCEKVCPAGCIDAANATLDNERCLRCMNCLAACRAKRIVFTAAREPVATQPLRRAFFLQGAATLAACFGLAKFATSKKAAAHNKKPAAVCPPGAGSPARLAALCTGCAACVVNCKGRVIHGPEPAKGIFFPHMNFDSNYCEFQCRRCAQVCPTGALRKMSLEEKQRCRIGLAEFDESLCVAVIDGTHCGACAEHCPTGALRMKDFGSGTPIPVLNEPLCIGCGACQAVCPVNPVRAIVIKPVSIQVQADDPQEFFKRTPPPPPPDPNEWAI